MKVNAPHFTPKMVDFVGGRTRTRTWDPLIKSRFFMCLVQWLVCKLDQFRHTKDQPVTAGM
jgi:hypothetical protein